MQYKIIIQWRGEGVELQYIKASSSHLVSILSSTGDLSTATGTASTRSILSPGVPHGADDITSPVAHLAAMSTH